MIKKKNYYDRIDALSKYTSKEFGKAVINKKKIDMDRFIDDACEECQVGELTIKKMLQRKEKAGKIKIVSDMIEVFEV